MAKVLATCPTSGQRVETKLDFDAKSWEKAAFTGFRYRCSACGELHILEKAKAILATQETP